MNRNVVAAHFARTNMGQRSASVDHLRQLFKMKDCRLDAAVNSLCADFMESDDHFDMFMAEAKSFLRMKQTASIEAIEAVWPDHAKLFREAMQ